MATKIGQKTVCIFAHPDDESFGPAGTIAKFAERGEVYLICVTNGNDKTNGRKKGLAKIRRKELVKSAEILGIKKIFFLDYKDGELKNNIYHRVSADIEKILHKLKPDNLITFELRGVSGHIDHVFCSMITTFVFQKLEFTKTLLYYAAPKQVSDGMKDYFIYFPQGYKKSEVDKVVDIKKYWDKKIKAIKAHQSQLDDAKKVLKLFNKLPKEEWFLISKK